MKERYKKKYGKEFDREKDKVELCKFVPCSKAEIELTDTKAPDYAIQRAIIHEKVSYNNGWSDTAKKGKCANYFNIKL